MDATRQTSINVTYAWSAPEVRISIPRANYHLHPCISILSSSREDKDQTCHVMSTRMALCYGKW